MRAIRIQQFGGPEAMGLEELPTPKPGDGQALVRIEAAGVNFIDVYQRTGPLQAAAAARPRAGGRRHRRGGGPRRRRRPVGDRVAWTGIPGVVRDARRGAGRPARHAAGGRRRASDGRGRDAPGHDGALPGALDVPAEGRRHLPGPRGRRRRRAAALPDGEAARARGSSAPSRPRRRRSSPARRAPTR